MHAILELENTLAVPVPLFTSKRFVLRNEEVVVGSDKANLVLFNDSLLIHHPKPLLISLENLICIPQGNRLALISGVLVSFNSTRSRDEWIIVAKYAIETFKNEKEKQVLQWVPDQVSNTCMMQDCNMRFNVFYRRHHCRACGQIICSKCSRFTQNQVRTCVSCFRQMHN